MKRSFGVLIGVVGLTATLGAFASYRFQAAGGWLPSIPEYIGPWEGVTAPIPESTLTMLGRPRAIGKSYRVPMATVEFTLVTAGPFENYHDPTVCVGGAGDYEFTAMRQLPIDGPGSATVRAMIFRDRVDPDIRMVMYYWQQTRDGKSSCEPMMGNFRDIAARLRTGIGAVVLGRQSVILRNFALYSQKADPDGIVAQRSVHEISRAIYRHLLKEGKAPS